MRSFFKLRTITWVFLVVYLLTGGTDGFARCLKMSARRSPAMATAGGERAPSIRETATGIPSLLRNQHDGSRSCLKLAPALTSTAGINLPELSGQLSLAAPAHLSRALSLALGAAAGKESRYPAPPPALVNPRLADIRAVVLLT
jgi:hypothetical protein